MCTYRFNTFLSFFFSTPELPASINGHDCKNILCAGGGVNWGLLILGREWASTRFLFCCIINPLPRAWTVLALISCLPGGYEEVVAKIFIHKNKRKNNNNHLLGHHLFGQKNLKTKILIELFQIHFWTHIPQATGCKW